VVSGGCIVSGSYVAHSVLFSEVRVHSGCHIDEAVVLPDVTIHRHCRLRKVVIDRGCVIPEALVVGEDAKLDALRFERSENGVSLITQEMLDKLK
jgi:glucose-1-phosphate adenylyltransferase